MMFQRFQAKFGGGETKAFTLIELLIVIAIILILIAIALPNFLEAQIRARVTKARGEMRTLATALEAYKLDWDLYPSYNYPNYMHVLHRGQRGLTWLTSPNAYITSIPEDPFPGEVDLEGNQLTGPPYTYTVDGAEIPGQILMFAHPHSVPPIGCLATYVIFSLGPDTPDVETVVDHYASPLCSGGSGCQTPIASYSPTNGTKSKGDLLQYGGEKRWMGADMYTLQNVAWPERWNSVGKPGQVVDGVRYQGTFPPHLTIF